jgi:hypothetical protein
MGLGEGCQTRQAAERDHVVIVVDRPQLDESGRGFRRVFSQDEQLRKQETSVIRVATFWGV